MFYCVYIEEKHEKTFSYFVKGRRKPSEQKRVVMNVKEQKERWNFKYQLEIKSPQEK